jgi:type VI secretion system secreted protein Hcp
MATNIFLKIETPEIKGESSHKGHEGQIEVLSWSHGVSQPTSPVRSTAGSGTVERANHQDLSFTKYVDIASTDLIKHCWAGTHFGKLTLAQYRSAGNDTKDVEFLTVELEDVVISSYQIGGGGGDIPIESISLAYGKVTYKYDPADQKTGAKKGNKPVSHDLKTNVVA